MNLSQRNLQLLIDLKNSLLASTEQEAVAQGEPEAAERKLRGKDFRLRDGREAHSVEASAKVVPVTGERCRSRIRRPKTAISEPTMRHARVKHPQWNRYCARGGRW